MQIYSSSDKTKLNTVSKMYCTIPLAKAQTSPRTCKNPILEGHNHHVPNAIQDFKNNLSIRENQC